jgi:AcrR family transcriptional regulator
MTPAKRLKSLNENITIQEVADCVGLPKRTLEQWFHTRRNVFEACLQYAILNRL